MVKLWFSFINLYFRLVMTVTPMLGCRVRPLMEWPSQEGNRKFLLIIAFKKSYSYLRTVCEKQFKVQTFPNKWTNTNSAKFAWKLFLTIILKVFNFIDCTIFVQVWRLVSYIFPSLIKPYLQKYFIIWIAVHKKKKPKKKNQNFAKASKIIPKEEYRFLKSALKMK
jgi:hypothetical protein